MSIEEQQYAYTGVRVRVKKKASSLAYPIRKTVRGVFKGRQGVAVCRQTPELIARPVASLIGWQLYTPSQPAVLTGAGRRYGCVALGPVVVRSFLVRACRCRPSAAAGPTQSRDKGLRRVSCSPTRRCPPQMAAAFAARGQEADDIVAAASFRALLTLTVQCTEICCWIGCVRAAVMIPGGTVPESSLTG